MFGIFKRKRKVPPKKFNLFKSVVRHVPFEKIQAAMVMKNYDLKKGEWTSGDYIFSHKGEEIVKINEWKTENFQVDSFIKDLTREKAEELVREIEVYLYHYFQDDIGESIRKEKREKIKKYQEKEYRKKEFVNNLFKEFN